VLARHATLLLWLLLLLLRHQLFLVLLLVEFEKCVVAVLLYFGLLPAREQALTVLNRGHEVTFLYDARLPLLLLQLRPLALVKAEVLNIDVWWLDVVIIRAEQIHSSELLIREIRLAIKLLQSRIFTFVLFA
jgi:hypothetical protein